jgi:ADP-heptose:LPS heptosyltransferase
MCDFPRDSCCTSRPPLGQETPRSALCVFQAGIGDALLALPALHQLRSAFPRIAVDAIVNRRVAPLLPLAGIPFRNIAHFEYSGGRVNDFSNLYRAVGIRSRRPDIGVLTYASSASRTAAWLFAAGCGRRVGHRYTVRDGSRVTRFLTDGLEVLPGRHFSLLNTDMVARIRGQDPIGGDDPVEPYRLMIDNDSTEQMNEWLQSIGVKDSRSVLAMHPGGGIDMRHKRWPAQRFAQTAARLCRKHDLVVAVIAGNDEYQECRSIVDSLDSRGVLVSGWPLSRIASLLRRATTLLSNDTGLMHLGAAAGTRVVALFGPTDPAESGPLGDHTVISTNAGCSPCHSREHRSISCDQGNVCMLNIKVDTVVEAVTRALRAQP